MKLTTITLWHDTDDIFKVIGSEVKVTGNICKYALLGEQSIYCGC